MNKSNINQIYLPWLYEGDILTTAEILKRGYGFTFIIQNNRAPYKKYMGHITTNGDIKGCAGKSLDGEIEADIKKYGASSFTRHILRFYQNEWEMEKGARDMERRECVIGNPRWYQ